MILKDVMYQQSGNSTVIFTTLPAPAYGTYKSKTESLEYVESLELWCQDLPPVILLHSQSMTVTTAL
jgi:potassium/chloride transporter 9